MTDPLRSAHWEGATCCRHATPCAITWANLPPQYEFLQTCSLNYKGQIYTFTLKAIQYTENTDALLDINNTRPFSTGSQAFQPVKPLPIVQIVGPL